MGSVSYGLGADLSLPPSLPVGDDRYLNLSSQKRPPGRNLGEHRSVRRSGTTSRGTVVLLFCLRMRRFPLALAVTIFVGRASTILYLHFTCGRVSVGLKWYWDLNLRVMHVVQNLYCADFCWL